MINTQLFEQAERGDAEAQNELGYLYDVGEGVEQNLELAAQWYRRSAENGHAGGQYNYAEMLRDGAGVAASPKDAIHWYRAAAKQKHARAAYNLAIMYVKGEGGLPADLVTAYAWIAIAEDAGADGANKAKAIIRNGLHEKIHAAEEMVAAFRRGDFGVEPQLDHPTPALAKDKKYVVGQAEYNGNPLIVRAQSEAIEAPPKSAYPYKLAFAIGVKAPKPQGLPTQDEASQLNAIEDKIMAAVDQEFEAYHCMTLTTGLMREIVFFVKPQDQAQQIGQQIAASIATHKVQVLYQADPQWQTVADFISAFHRS